MGSCLVWLLCANGIRCAFLLGNAWGFFGVFLNVALLASSMSKAVLRG